MAPVPARRSDGALGVSGFIDTYYQHFNAATLKDAAYAWLDLLDNGGQMFLAMAGAMSTGEIGRTLAPLIQENKIHAICCTGANLEEDLFNLVAHTHYERIPDYHELTPADDAALAARHVNRVTDTGIPEQAAMTPIEDLVIARWKAVDESRGDAIFPHEPLYEILRSGELEASYQIDPADSWLLAAAERDLPIFVPGWEDSTLGNVFAAECFHGELQPTIIKGGIHYMMALADWYRTTSESHDLGFFQIGGGIAGDFSICVVPMLEQDVGLKDTKLWQYFCQITDSHESVGGYSGALPTEKRSWKKLPAECPAFSIFGDASIIAPLIFARMLGW